MGHSKGLRLSKGCRKRHGYQKWESDYLIPTGKQEKRLANKRVRRADVSSGGGYRKCYRPMEWS